MGASGAAAPATPVSRPLPRDVGSPPVSRGVGAHPLPGTCARDPGWIRVGFRATKAGMMDWHKRFKTKACTLKLAAGNKESALGEVVRSLVAAGLLSAELAEDALGALLAREEIASTGVGMNVAIPHVRLDGLEESVCSLALAPDGIEWAAVDGEPVQILFVVLRPGEATDRHDPEEHLEMMRWIARLARDADFRAFALRAKNRTEMLALLKEMKSVR